MQIINYKNEGGSFSTKLKKNPLFQDESCKTIRYFAIDFYGEYISQQKILCTFNGNDSWVILSPIERQIKKKTERIGTPLKDWDIQINYRIKTGFNDAFIIDGENEKNLL